MARAQARDGMGWVHGSLIAFVFLWLVSTVLLVWLWTDQKAIQDKEQKLAKDLRLIASPDEKQNLEYFRLASDSGPTAMGLAEAARAETAKLATGTPEDKVSAVQGKTSELVNQIVNDALVPTPSAFQGVDLLATGRLLYELYRDQKAQLDDAQIEVKRLTDEAVKLAGINEKQQADFDAKIGEVHAALDEISTVSSDFRKDKDAALAVLETRINELRQEAAKQSQSFRAEKAQLDQQVADLQTRYGELRGKMGQLQISPESMTTARKGDGIILKADPMDEIAYIDLGKDDHIVLGTRFAVYSRETGIPASGEAKAQIEIVTIYDRASACRVTRRQPGTYIMEGDLIANPMYDREKSLRFVVVGEFDVDGDGQADPGGAAQVEAVIGHWGGELLDEISSAVDFVIVGTRPRLPYSGAELSPEEEARNQVAQKALDAYESVAKQAQSLSIPTMTQPVLARFLGYDDARLPGM